MAKLRSEGFRHMQFVVRMPDGWRNIAVTLIVLRVGVLSANRRFRAVKARVAVKTRASACYDQRKDQ
ncbi:MAG: hypothetical protein ACLP6G_15940 [Terriglobales bacterium]